MALVNQSDLRVYSYFNSENQMNSYVLWKRDVRQAIIIDPVVLDVGLFEIISSNDLEIAVVLLTHADEDHFHAVKTIPKIYPNVQIYGGGRQIFDLPVGKLTHHRQFEAAGFSITPIFLSGHHSDSLCYHVMGMLFPGDVLSAGSMARADGGFGRKLLCQCIVELILRRDENELILPLFGPPSTVGIEKKSNAVIRELCLTKDPDLQDVGDEPFRNG